MAKCASCGYELDDGAELCPYCGADVETPAKQTVRPADRMSENSVKQAVVVLLLCLAVMALAALNVVQFFAARRTQQQYAQDNFQLQAKISEQKERAAQLRDSLHEKQQKLLNLEDLAANYENIRDNLSTGRLGYISNEFKTNIGVIVLDKNDRDQTFTLTADLGADATISVSYSSNAANVEFTEQTWSKRTTVRVLPIMPGATVVTFSNSVNTQTFQILILVTESETA